MIFGATRSPHSIFIVFNHHPYYFGSTVVVTSTTDATVAAATAAVAVKTGADVDVVMKTATTIAATLIVGYRVAGDP